MVWQSTEFVLGNMVSFLIFENLSKKVKSILTKLYTGL